MSPSPSDPGRRTRAEPDPALRAPARHRRTKAPPPSNSVEETGPLDALIAPVGGGGLIAGSATAVEGPASPAPGSSVSNRRPVDDMPRRSLEAGRRVTRPGPAHHRRRPGPAHPRRADLLPQPATARRDRAGLRRRDPGRDALRLERLKTVLEPSGATPLAALLTGRAGPLTGRVGGVLSGGNGRGAASREPCGRPR